MKKFIIFFILLALLVTGGLLTVKSMTAGLTSTADQFFKDATEGDLAAAEGLLSQSFRQEFTPGRLDEFLTRTGLNRRVSSTWSTTRYQGSSGELEGRVFTDTGAVIPVRLEFVKEQDAWRIHGLDAHMPSLTVDTDGDAVPDLATLEQMVSQSIHDLAMALRMDDFAAFRSYTSTLWQATSTPEGLKAAFAPFAGHGEELMGYSDVRPVFNKTPVINDDGVLHLQGSVPQPQGVLRFDMDFVFEYPDWKLRGLRLAY